MPPLEAATTIAVLPFENLSADPEQAYFARGFVDDLMTELSRFPSLLLVHATQGSAPPPGSAAHVLRGGVRRLGDTVRIAAQLIEAGSGQQIWAARFDAPAEGLFAAQDDIVGQVASALAVEVDGARLGRARRKPLSSLEVYDCWLRGIDCLRRGTVEDDARARAFFDRALVLDPHCARAHAGISLSHFNEWSCQAWELWDEKERLAFEHAHKAATLDDRDALVQLVLGRIFLYRGRFDEGARHVDRAVELNPNDADVLAHASLCRAYLGDMPSAIALGEKAFRLNPTPPLWYPAGRVIAAFLLGRYDEVIRLAAGAPQATVDVPAYLAAACALSGDMARARAYTEMFLADFVEKITFGRAPEVGEPLRWILHVNPFRRAEDAEHVARGLHAAGLAADPDVSRPSAVPASVPAGAKTGAFHKDGELWSMTFEGVRVQLSEAKGFCDLVELLARPQTSIHCLDLAGRSSEPRGDAPALDARARRELGERARVLQAELDEAEERNDLGAAESARTELDRLVSALADAVGLGGKARRIGSAAERARTAVTWRIRNAIRKIGAVHPALGRHLENSVRTGTWCTYSPETDVHWELETGGDLTM